MCSKTTSKHSRRASHPEIPVIDPSVPLQPTTAKNAAVLEKHADLSQLSGEELDQLLLDIEIEENRRVYKVDPPKGLHTELMRLSDKALQERKAEAIAELEKRIDPIVAERLRDAGEKLKQENAGLLAEPPVDESRQARDALDATIANAHRVVADFRINSPVRIPLVTEADAAKKELVRNTPSPTVELTDCEKTISGVETTAQPSAVVGTPQGFGGLGQKGMDLSQYFDTAKLTDRQHECASMRFEYELPFTEIARRLDLHHKTVQDHVIAATKRLERDEKFKQALKRRAAHRGSHDESD